MCAPARAWQSVSLFSFYSNSFSQKFPLPRSISPPKSVFRVKGGDKMTDPNRLEELIRTHQDTLYRTALAILGDPQEAEDAVQDAFLRCLEKAPEFESGEHAKAWLLRVTINRSKSFLRSAWQKRTEGLPEALSDETFTPRESAVLDAVAGLPQKYRQVVYLYYVEGYSSAELARLLHLPQNTVLSRLSRARGRLAILLKGEFDDVER